MPDVGRCRVGIRVVTILDDVLSCEAVVSGQAPLSSLRGDVDKTWARRVFTTNTIMLNVEQERARQKKPKKKPKKPATAKQPREDDLTGGSQREENGRGGLERRVCVFMT